LVLLALVLLLLIFSKYILPNVLSIFLSRYTLGDKINTLYSLDMPTKIRSSFLVGLIVGDNFNGNINDILCPNNIIYFGLLLFSLLALFRYRYTILIMINNQENYFYFNLINRLLLFRHIIFSSLILIYFLYSYINLNIEFKEMFKLFDLLFSKNFFIIDFVNDKLGLNIYFADETNETDRTHYVRNENEEYSEDNKDSDKNESNSSDSDPARKREVSPNTVIVDEIPEIIPDDIISESEFDSADDEDVSDYDDSDNNDASEEDGDNPEFSQKSEDVMKTKSYLNSLISHIKDSRDAINEAVKDIQINLSKNSEIENIYSDDNNKPKSLKRGREDDEMDVDIPSSKKIRFIDAEAKERYEEDMQIVIERTKTLEKYSKNYTTAKSKLRDLTGSIDSNDNT
jgi:hypothetical protein